MSDFSATDWSLVPELVDTLFEKCAAPAWSIRSKVSSVYTSHPVGYYWNPYLEKAGCLFSEESSDQERLWCCAALQRAVGIEKNSSDALTLADVSTGRWVKVAESPFIKRLAEYGNFFPAADIPYNNPSPLAAMLTSGLLGAGLGYGVGWAGEKMLPGSLQGKKRLRKTLSRLGAVMGAAPGATWAAANLADGRSLNDASLVTPSTKEPGSHNRIDINQIKEKSASNVYQANFDLESAQVLGNDLLEYLAEDMYKEGMFSAGAGAQGVQPVNTNRLGQVLWDTGASPQTAATTMSSMYAAQQLPGGAGPNQVTPHQTGLLASMMGAAGGGLKGYATGWAVGKGLGILTGMPQSSQNTLKGTGAALGVINTLVPRLFN